MKELIEALQMWGIASEEGEPTEYGGTIVLSAGDALDLLEVLGQAHAWMDLRVHVYIEPDRAPDVIEVLERLRPGFRG